MKQKQIEKIDTNFKRTPQGLIYAPSDIILDLANKINEIIDEVNKLKK